MGGEGEHGGWENGPPGSSLHQAHKTSVGHEEALVAVRSAGEGERVGLEARSIEDRKAASPHSLQAGAKAGGDPGSL
jgi:hypothetical protein